MKKSLFLGIIIAIIIGILSFLFYIILSDGDLLNREPASEFEVSNKDRILERDGFSILMPAGWRLDSGNDRYIKIVVNAKENNSDVNSEFKTYYGISITSLEDDQTMEEFIEYNKGNISKKKEPRSEIISEGYQDINGKQVYLIDYDFTEEEIEYKHVLYFFNQQENVWVINFTTQKRNWPDYQDIYKQIVDSFEIKQNN